MILAHNRAAYYYVYKFVRRMQRRQEPPTLWPSVEHVWHEWLHALLSSEPRKVDTSTRSDFVMYTDASTTG